MKMQRAFDIYFDKLIDYSLDMFGTKPTVAYTDSLNKQLLISSPDEEGEVEWRLQLQNSVVDWNEIETELNFDICDELKEYYSTYYFLSLSGKIQSTYLYFYPIDGTKPIKAIIKQQYSDAQFVFPQTQYFLIGNAVVNDDDSYFIYYDNKTGELFCYESDTNNKAVLPNTLTEIIGSMEAR